jgi:hypothetical protein
MTKRKAVLFFLLPLLLSFILHFRVLKLDLIGYHVWRQTQTQTVIYNFNFSDNSILNPQRFDLSTGTSRLLYEFPLYQWIIAQYNHVFGYSVLHTRAITFVIFGLFLLGFYKVLRNFFSIEVALITNWLVCFSPLLYYYCVNPLPDMLALCLAAWSLYFFFRFVNTKNYGFFILFSSFLMLSSLVKLPYLLFFGISIPYFLKSIRERNYTRVMKEMLIFLMFMAPVAIWYAIAIPTWGNNLIAQGMFRNSKPVIILLDYLQFNVISSVPELLTNYAACIFLVTGILLFFKRKMYLNKAAQNFLLLLVLLVLYFLYELNMIEKTHDYYLLPFILPIFLVVALGVKHIFYSRFKTIVFIVIFLVPITAWLRINGRWDTQSPGFNVKYLNDQAVLQKTIPRNALCLVDHDDSKFIALYYLKRNGFSLEEGMMNSDNLKKFYASGARYLITENNDFNPVEFSDFEFEKIHDDTLKIYRISQQ